MFLINFYLKYANNNNNNNNKQKEVERIAMYGQKLISFDF